MYPKSPLFFLTALFFTLNLQASLLDLTLDTSHPEATIRSSLKRIAESTIANKESLMEAISELEDESDNAVFSSRIADALNGVADDREENEAIQEVARALLAQIQATIELYSKKATTAAPSLPLPPPSPIRRTTTFTITNKPRTGEWLRLRAKKLEEARQRKQPQKKFQSDTSSCHRRPKQTDDFLAAILCAATGKASFAPFLFLDKELDTMIDPRLCDPMNPVDCLTYRDLVEWLEMLTCETIDFSGISEFEDIRKLLTLHLKKAITKADSELKKTSAKTDSKIKKHCEKLLNFLQEPRLYSNDWSMLAPQAAAAYICKRISMIKGLKRSPKTSSRLSKSVIMKPVIDEAPLKLQPVEFSPITVSDSVVATE